MVRSPVRRARLLRFLYFGLKGFKMHAIVDLIPTLLHISLFTFFGGLIAFLSPVNSILTWLIVAATTITVIAYLAFTVLPLIRLEAPYRTPLSAVLWVTLQGFRKTPTQVKGTIPTLRELFKGTQRFLQRNVSVITTWRSSSSRQDPEAQEEENNEKGTSSLEAPPFVAGNTRLPSPTHPIHQSEATLSLLAPPAPTQATSLIQPRTVGESGSNSRWNLTRAMLDASRISCPDQEGRAIAWTLKALNDDRELLPFVEALVDLLWGQDGLRTGNLHYIRPLLETIDPDCDIIGRTFAMMNNMDNSWFEDNHRQRCRIACPRLLYVLAYLLLDQRGMFTLPTALDANGRRISWFSTEIVAALFNGMGDVRSSNRLTLDHASASSAYTLCILTICQDIEDSLSNNDDSALSAIQEFLSPSYLDMLGSFYKSVPLGPQRYTLFVGQWQEDGTPGPPYYGYRYDAGKPVLNQLRQHIGFLRSATFNRYISNGLTCFPYLFALTASKFEPLVFGDHDSSGLALLCGYLESYDEQQQTSGQTQRSEKELDSMFAACFSQAKQEDSPLVTRYISRRIEKAGWTTTLDLWETSEARWKHLLEVMPRNGPIGGPDPDLGDSTRNTNAYVFWEPAFCMEGQIPPWPDAYREILLCLAYHDNLDMGPPDDPLVVSQEAYSLLSDVHECLYQQVDKTRPQRCLNFLVDLIAIAKARRSGHYDEDNYPADRVRSIVDDLFVEMQRDPNLSRFLNGNSVALESPLLFQLLLAKVLHDLDPLDPETSPMDTKNALEYFWWIGLGEVAFEDLIPTFKVLVESGYASELAQKIHALCNFWRINYSPAVLKIILMLWDLLVPPASFHMLGSEVAADVTWSMLHYLNSAADILLSSEGLQELEKARPELNHVGPGAKTSFYRYSKDPAADIARTKRVLERVCIPYSIPLPEPEGDEMLWYHCYDVENIVP